MYTVTLDHNEVMFLHQLCSETPELKSLLFDDFWGIHQIALPDYKLLSVLISHIREFVFKTALINKLIASGRKRTREEINLALRKEFANITSSVTEDASIYFINNWTRIELWHENNAWNFAISDHDPVTNALVRYGEIPNLPPYADPTPIIKEILNSLPPSLNQTVQTFLDHYNQIKDLKLTDIKPEHFTILKDNIKKMELALATTNH